MNRETDLAQRMALTRERCAKAAKAWAKVDGPKPEDLPPSRKTRRTRALTVASQAASHQMAISKTTRIHRCDGLDVM